MAGYTSKWTCRICAGEQDTIDEPKLCVCDECLGAVATRLCLDTLGVEHTAPGIDSKYWLWSANRLVAPMLARYQLPPGMAVPTVAAS